MSEAIGTLTASPVLRYPGGKRRLLGFLDRFLPARQDIAGRYVEPFLGGGAVFFHLQPATAILSDSNPELIDVYRGIRDDPSGVWRRYRSYKGTKEEYHRLRILKPDRLGLTSRAARSLYLNRTCFKGNWRHNAKGQFNIGYGGQSRRWVITQDCLLAVSNALRHSEIVCCDFESVLSTTKAGDFLFLDPPYQPGKKEPANDHYAWKHFTFSDHERLARALRLCSARGVNWCLTTSSHPDILALFQGFPVVQVPTNGGKAGHAQEVIVLGQGDRDE